MIVWVCACLCIVTVSVCVCVCVCTPERVRVSRYLLSELTAEAWEREEPGSLIPVIDQHINGSAGLQLFCGRVPALASKASDTVSGRSA